MLMHEHTVLTNFNTDIYKNTWTYVQRHTEKINVHCFAYIKWDGKRFSNMWIQIPNKTCLIFTLNGQLLLFVRFHQLLSSTVSGDVLLQAPIKNPEDEFTYCDQYVSSFSTVSTAH